jgi:hypothetical protein
MAPGGVEPPPADSKFGPESRQPETHREDSAYRSRFCPRVGFVISAYLGGSGGPTVAPFRLVRRSRLDNLEHRVSGETSGA